MKVLSRRAKPDSYVKSLLYFDGADASTTIIDKIGKTWTASGTAQLDTAIKRFGTASLLVDGDSDYVSTADHDDFNMGTGNCTIDFWFYAPDQTNNYPGIISSSDYNSSGSMSIRYDNASYASKLFIYINGGGDPVLASTNTIANSTITHIAITRTGTSLKVYVNGVLDGSATIDVNLGIDLSVGELRIGRGFDVDTTAAYFSGHVDDVRISKGVVRWTSDFTPPTRRY